MKTGITFGAYDPLHYGHLEVFRRARNQCDRLVVCVSDSAYIQEKKGHPERVPLTERMRALLLLRPIDDVDVQSLEQSKKDLIDKHGADVIYVGDDWTPETFTGEGLGIPVVYLPHTKNISSTGLWHTNE